MKNTIFYVLSLLTLSGCVGGTGFVIKEKVIDNYYLIATDVDEDLVLSYHEDVDGDNYGTIIDATIFAVGHNDKFIIVKQHPRISPNAPDKKITNYYILPLKKGMDWRSKNGLIGPLTLKTFNEKRKELEIPEGLTFTKEIENLK